MKVFFKLSFPNESDGSIEVTPQELHHLVEVGEVRLRAQHVRPIAIQRLAETYQNNPDLVPAAIRLKEME